MEELRRLQGDKNTKEALINFIDAFIGQYAIEKVLKREDVSGIADAKTIIDKAFESLDIEYGIKERESETSNTSR